MSVRQCGVVIQTQNGMAKVRFARSEMCGECHACFQDGEDEAEIMLENTVGATTGDKVLIELHESAVFKASLIMYGVPLLGLLLGVLCFSPLGDIYAAVGGVLLSAASFFLLRAFEPRFAKMKQFKPRITGIAEDSDAEGSS